MCSASHCDQISVTTIPGVQTMRVKVTGLVFSALLALIHEAFELELRLAPGIWTTIAHANQLLVLLKMDDDRQQSK